MKGAQSGRSARRSARGAAQHERVYNNSLPVYHVVLAVLACMQRGIQRDNSITRNHLPHPDGAAAQRPGGTQQRRPGRRRQRQWQRRRLALKLVPHIL